MTPTTVAWLRRAGRYIGRRGAALMVFAWADLAIAYGLLDPGQRPTGRGAVSYVAIRDVLPFWVWGLLWLAAAVACFAAVAARPLQAAGFAATALIMILWAAGFAVAAIGYHAPRAWVGAVTWAVIAAFVFLVGGWPEPAERPRSPR